MKELLRDLRPVAVEAGYYGLAARIDAALSQQTEPVEPAPVQDEREAPEVVGCLMLGGIEHWSDGPEYGDIDIAPCAEGIRNAQVRLVTSGDDVHLDLMTVAQHERIVASLTRPAQTEQQPERAALAAKEA